MYSQKQNYGPIPAVDEESTSLFDEAGQQQFTTRKRGSRKTLTLAFVSILFNMALMSYIVFNGKWISKSPIVSDLSYRPASFETIRRKFNGTLFPPAEQSWSRLGPGPEADALWKWYEPTRLIPLSRLDLMRMGKSPEKSVQFNENYEVPEDSYVGAIDIFHKIHCLNQLRKMTFDGYQSGQRRQHDDLQWIHMRHCIDMIAQDLQCNANLDIITYTWTDGQTDPYPDFEIERTCTNWDQFIDWTEKNTLDNSKNPDFMRRPPGVVPIPAEDGYYEMFGFSGSVLYPNGNGYKENH